MLIIMFCFVGTGSSNDVVATAYLSIPFEDNVDYNITSEFGTRVDPIDSSQTLFHSGLDMTAPIGTSIVSSADGVVYEVGYSEDGLGNYVYVEHKFGDIKIYTMYGHMLDNSIVVKKGDTIKAKQKIGVIGSSGRSTGVHLHFMISKNKISFEEKDLIDPILVINN